MMFCCSDAILIISLQGYPENTHMHVPFISSSFRNHCLPPPTDTLTALATGMEVPWNSLYCDVSWILRTKGYYWGYIT